MNDDDREQIYGEPHIANAYPVTLLKVEEAAKILRVAGQTVYRWARIGYIPCWRVGDLIRIPYEELIAEIRRKGGNMRMRRFYRRGRPKKNEIRDILPGNDRVQRKGK